MRGKDGRGVSRRAFLAAGAAAARHAAAQAAPKKPNIIHINVDTWAPAWLGCYGNTAIRTPNLDALAARSCLFMDAYAEGLYTIPVRRAIYTGRRVFPGVMVRQWDDVAFRGWHPLFVEDVTMAETLLDAGYLTALVSDLFHQFKTEKNFHRGFLSWQWIRGQQIDRYRTGPRRGIDVRQFLHPSQITAPNLPASGSTFAQYLINRARWRTEDDWLAARVFGEAAAWIEDNYEDPRPFYLHIESFSPHPFWDPPEDYYRLYMKSDYSGPRLIYPPDSAKVLSPLEMEHVRALYSGYVTFTDAQIGKLLAKVRQLGLMENTVITFTADHGAMLGEQGQIHKGEGTLRTQVTRVPLLFYTPWGAGAGRKVSGFVQHPDWMPTVLDLVGIGFPDRVTGESLKPLIENGGESRREWIIGGFHNHGFIRTRDYLYIGRWNPGEGWEEIYDPQRDPQELTNIIERQTALRDKCRAQLKEHVDASWDVIRGSFIKAEDEGR